MIIGDLQDGHRKTSSTQDLRMQFYEILDKERGSYIRDSKVIDAINRFYKYDIKFFIIHFILNLLTAFFDNLSTD